MKFCPLGNMVLIQTVMAAETSVGGIVLPDSARQKPDEGVIIAIGPGVEKLFIGDRVIFGKYVGMELDIPGMEKNVLLLHETDVYGKLEKENNHA